MDKTLTLPAISQIRDRNIQQWCGLMAIEPTHAEAFLDRLQRMNWSEHVQQAQLPSAAQSFATMENNEQVAVVEMRGVMSKHGSSVNQEGSTIMARRQIRQAMMDDDITETLFVIESPGGTAVGTKELADDVAAHKEVKPITVFVEDIGASAALEVAVQASNVYANAPAVIGSIGTYLTVVDSSEAAEKEGYKVHVISTGEYKGAMARGSKITQEQLDHMQQLVDSQNEFFKQAIRDGRGMSAAAVDQLADGRVWLAQDAADLGLIDGVLSFDDLLDRIGVQTMSTKTSAGSDVQLPSVELAATLPQLKVALPGADESQLISYLEKKATVTEAQTSYIEDIHSELADLKDKLTSLEEDTTQLSSDLAEANKTIDALKQSDDDDDVGTGPSTEVKSALEEAIEHEMQTKGLNREQASVNVSQSHPELFESFLAAHE